MRRLALVLVAITGIAACGADPAGPGASSDGPSEAAGTDLTITVLTDRDVEPKVMTLTCDPTGGDHPNGDAACAGLAAAEASVFEPVPTDQACTKIYGGPQTATITGILQGVEIDASFSRADGCEIDRWDALGTEVFDVPML